MTDTYDHGGNIFAIARARGVSPEDILDFSASINPLGLARGVREYVHAGFDRVLHYPDTDATELKHELASYHGLKASQVIVANGSTELIHIAPRLVGEGRGLIIAPAFSEYAKAMSGAGMGIDNLILPSDNGFSFPLETLEKKLEEGFRILFLCNPGNPSGALVPLPVISAIQELCRAAGTFLVLDEAFMDFCEEGSAKHLVPAGGDAVVLRSMTKFFAIPGLRVGYAIAAPELIVRLQRLRGPWSVNTPAQLAGIASLRDGEYRKNTLRYIEEERALLSRELAGIAGLEPCPSSANYLLVRITGGFTAGDLVKELAGRLILIRDCSGFEGLDGRFFRVAVRKREENEKLVEALREILS